MLRMHRLAQAFSELEGTTGRLAMERTLADLFRATPPECLPPVVYLTQGALRPAYEGVEIGVGAQAMLRVLATAFATPLRRVEELYAQLGDLGTVAQALAPGRASDVPVREVYDALLEVARVSGTGATERRIERLAALLRRLGNLEARYVVRMCLGRLRLGVGDPTLLNGLSLAFQGNTTLRPLLERAYNLRPDLGWLAQTLATTGPDALHEVTPTPGVPIRPALAERLPSAAAIISRLGRCQVEPKYDGLRVQIHRAGNQISIFSRRLENLTAMLPEVVAAVPRQLAAAQCIVEGEALVTNPETNEFLPFQVTAQRRRKYRVAEMSERYPLRVMLFDLLLTCGQDYTRRPLIERRAALAELLHAAPDDILQLTPAQVVAASEALQAYMDECISQGLEGVLAKRLDAPYQAGTRNFNWIKLKRSVRGVLADTIDTVIVGYLLGKGARARLGIGSLLTAVYDPETDRFYTIARVGSGLSEADWQRLHDLLQAERTPGPPPRVVSDFVPDVWVLPRFVLEVQADEITRSPIHTAGKRPGQPGYALRFPRAVGWLRMDKAPEDATTVSEIVAMYQAQRRQPQE